MAPAIERAVRALDADVPVVRLREMDEVFAGSIRRPRLLGQLLAIFAGLALVLAAVGTYGVFACLVLERRREIGVRLALGASRAGVIAQTLTHGLRMAGAGLVLGVAATLAVTRWLSTFLFGVQPTDAPTLAVVVITIAGVAGLACWLPAWRASRLDPNVVLRTE